MIAQHLSLTAEHPTPQHVVEAARRTLGSIDLDPASSVEFNTHIGAFEIFTAEDDGLRQIWRDRVFLNPPGGRTPANWKKVFETASNATAWWRKLMRERQFGHVDSAIFVGFTLEILRTSQSDGYASALTFPFCVPRERLCFGGDQPTHANVIVYTGPDLEAFKREFSPIGEVRP